MNANANDALVAALVVGALVALASPPARGARSRSAPRPSSAPRRWRRCSRPATGERRWRSAGVFALAFAAVSAL